MTTDTTPVKPAMTDAETEAMIAEYLTRKLAPIFAAAKDYSTLTVEALCFHGRTTVQFDAYTNVLNHERSDTANECIGRIMDKLQGPSARAHAAEIREKAAQMITQASQIEAAADAANAAAKGGA